LFKGLRFRVTAARGVGVEVREVRSWLVDAALVAGMLADGRREAGLETVIGAGHLDHEARECAGGVEGGVVGDVIFEMEGKVLGFGGL
jgi:hypothetical protein